MVAYWWTLSMLVQFLRVREVLRMSSEQPSGNAGCWCAMWLGSVGALLLKPPTQLSLPCWGSESPQPGEADTHWGIWYRSPPSRSSAFVVPLLIWGNDITLISLWETSIRIQGNASSATNLEMFKILIIKQKLIYTTYETSTGIKTETFKGVRPN